MPTHNFRYLINGDEDFTCNFKEEIKEGHFSEEDEENFDDMKYDDTSGKKKFSCDICPKKYETMKSLLYHIKYTHGKDKHEQFKCTKCYYVTIRKNDFKRHLKIHDKKMFLKCHFCQYMAPHLQHLNAHVLRKHKLQNEGKNKIKTAINTHTCTKCSYSTFNESHYENHLNVCLKLKNAQWYKCHLCPYKTLHKGHLNPHIKTHNEVKELKCLFCKFQSNKKQSLDNHILSKHSDCLNESNRNIITSKIHFCEHCKYKTTHTSCFRNHLKNQH
ncbi:unnamed protein product [Brassicogethes aeneus]|uniref:C2H2-type domain-containing protein n=1 Tax=Brassicogethes aeneus TaxID=1431903 RepID=A0A9P0FBG6_BRAAE|nr:unnamed protein product [Brassicogethes aeneus]